MRVAVLDRRAISSLLARVHQSRRHVRKLCRDTTLRAPALSPFIAIFPSFCILSHDT